MGTEVIENYRDTNCIRIVIIGELAHLLNKLFLRPLFRYIDMAPAAEQFADQEEVTRSAQRYMFLSVENIETLFRKALTVAVPPSSASEIFGALQL